MIVKWDPSNSRDNASAGLSGRQLIDAYKIDGTRLWRIDLGRNIRAGAHYTQFMVYDLDGDGRAEVACKTADGTVDGAGTAIGDATKDYRSLLVPTDGIQVPATNDARYGKVLAGPNTSPSSTARPAPLWRQRSTCPVAIRSAVGAGSAATATTTTTATAAIECWPAVAYLDGRLPSVVMARGYYGRSVLAAWDWRNGQLTSRWVFDSGIGVATLSLSHRLAVLGPGQSQSLGCRRRCRRQGRDRLRIDGRGRRRHGTVLDQAAARRRAARQRHGPVETRPRSLRHPRERRSDDRPRYARHGALRRAHRRDYLEQAAWSGCRSRDGGRHRSAITRLRVLGRRLGWSGGWPGSAHCRRAELGESCRVVGRRPSPGDRGQQLDQQVGLATRARWCGC